MNDKLRLYSELTTELAGLEIISDRNQVAKLSLDYYHFSPILQTQLADKRGDLVVLPNSETEIIRVVTACVDRQIPLTIRGAGTGNYGQCIPLQGGVILDLSKMNRIKWIKPGSACVEPGIKMAAFDQQARASGWELRIAPSTYRTATIGGFVAGGSVGMGSINYGQISDRGNLQAVRVITIEEKPQILTLQGNQVQQVIHGYGTTGIITELEIALAPTYPWQELIVIFDDFLKAAKFGQALSDSNGIVKKMVSVHSSPIPSYFKSIQNYLRPNTHCALLMVSEYDLESCQELVSEFGGSITYSKTASETDKSTSLLEFSWNHTTLHARSVDPSLTYLQTFYFTINRVEQMYNHFGNEIAIHLEFLKSGGSVIPAGLQLFKFSTPERLQAIIDFHEENGAFIANPHQYTIEDGGNKQIDQQKVAFKHKIDPHGLLNPGKMRGFVIPQSAQ